MPHILLVSPEVYPLGGGGIGVYTTALAQALAPVMDVTIVTTADLAAAHEGLLAARSAVIPDSVDVVFVPEVGDADRNNPYRRAHGWSGEVFAAIKRGLRHGPASIIEFPDWGGSGCVTVQARRTDDPSLRDTVVCTRLHASMEICAVLNGFMPQDPDLRKLYDLERFVLRYADRVLWAGGDILGTYQRFYGADSIARAEQVRHPLLSHPAADSAGGDEPGGTDLRLLFTGRLERRKGVDLLVRAMARLDRDDVRLTLAGADTRTAPLGVSVREQLELASGRNPRIEFAGSLPHAELLALVASSHVGVMPSRWECWPTSTLEFLQQNRPVLGTPTRGLLELAEEGVSGWLTTDCSAAAIASSIASLAADRGVISDVIRRGAPRSHLAGLTDLEGMRERYQALAETARRRPIRKPHASPLVSTVITYFELDQFVADAVRSVCEQTYERLEVIVVNDGSFRAADTVLSELAERYPLTVLSQVNSGFGAARNFGISQCQGVYVLPLDSDNVLEPEFVDRCVSALEQDSTIAYVTSWERPIDGSGNPISPPDWQWHYRFVSNFCRSHDVDNLAGDASVVFRRALFGRGFDYSSDLASYEDWALYRLMARAGEYGHVIPEPLIRYRVREESALRAIGKPNHERLVGEVYAFLREREMTWQRPA